MRAPAVLGAVAALLAAYLLFFDRAPRPAIQPEASLLLKLDPGSVNRITIARAGQPPLDLSRGGHGELPWHTTGQPDQLANAGAVQDLLSELARAELQRTSDVSPAEAGLSPPAVTLWVYGGDLASEVRLGRADASGRGVFAQRGSGPPVVVVPRRLATLALESDFRDRRLFPVAPDDVIHVAWQLPDGDRHEWDGSGERWKNDRGQPLRRERVEAILRRLTELQPADQAASSPDEGWIELRDRSGRVLRVSASRLPEPARQDLGRALAAAEQPDLRILATAPERVRRIELQDGARRLALVRDAGDRPWRFAAGPTRDVDQTAVADWLARLARTEVQASAKSSAKSPNESGRRLVVDGAEADAVTVGPSDPAYPELEPDPRRFQSRNVLDFAHFDARQLRRISAAGTLEARSADGESWSSAPPADSAGVARIVTALGNLHAEAWLPRAPAGRPDLVLEISVQAPGDPAPVRHTVELWPGCQAEMEDAGAFRVAQDRCADLRLDPAFVPSREAVR